MEAISRIAERRILKAQEEGVFDNLSNAGRPLVFQDETWIPEDLRTAYRVLKSAGFVPEELSLKREIMNLRDLIETIDDDMERLKKIRELNFKLLCFNIKRERGLKLQRLPEYEDRVLHKISGIT